MEQALDWIELDIEDKRRFLADAFDVAGAEDLFRWADDRNLTSSLFEAMSRMTVKLDGELTLPAGSEAEAERLESMGVLIGKRRHLKLKQASWQVMLGTLPLLVSLVAASVGPGDVVSALTGLIQGISGNLERLEPEEWQIYLASRKVAATKKRPGRREEILEELQSRGKESGSLDSAVIAKKIDQMVRRGVLAETKEGGLKTVF
jgi:hypothetical protein